MTPDEIAEQLALARISPLVHFESCVKIEDKQKRRVRPKANIFQRRLFQAYECLLPIALKRGIQIRILGLKIRQCGGTTASCHLIYHHSQRFPTESVVFANIKDNSQAMLSKIKLFSDTDILPDKRQLEPNQTKLRWCNGSQAEITSADAPNAGISRTRQFGLFSEAAKYPRGGVKDDKAIMAGALPSLSGDGTVAIAETTGEGACYDSETEVLTDKGWKYFADLDGDEGIMTKPPAGGPVYYQYTWKKQVHHHKGDMIRLKNSRSVDLLVTPNHSVWCASVHGKMKMRRADTLAPRADYVFERSLEWHHPKMESFVLPPVTFRKGNGAQTLPALTIPLNVWLPFLGHWLSDGGVMCRQRKDRPKLRRNTVYVTQTQAIESFRASAMALAPFIRGKVKEVDHGRGKRWIIDDTQLAKYLHNYSQPKRIPRALLMGMSKAQCQTLLDAIYEGDGDNDRRNGKRRFDCGKVYVGIDKTLRDDVMELCLKAGYSVSSNGKPRNMRACFRRCHLAHLQGTTGPKRVTGYDGLVYCVSLPKDHLLMVRRGGQAVWCGNSGWFYEQYHGTKEMTGALTLDQYLDELVKGNMSPGNGWVKVFAAWFEFEENREQVSTAMIAHIDATLTPREYNGRQKYGWTHEQIQWRRATMKSDCGGSEDLFDEYYPEDEVSCFLTSGRPRFNMASVVAMEKRAQGHAWESGNLTMQDNGTVTFAPQPLGFAPILILEKPLPGCRYIVTCDPATGEDQTESADPDRTSILVLRAGYTMGDVVKPTRVVARVRAPFKGEADETGKHIEALSRYYGDAMCVLEINMGLHVMEHLKETGIPLYKREVIDPYDREAERFMWGWKLKDRDQRRTVVDCLAIAIRDGSIDLADAHLINEAKTFIWAKNGREEARAGTHDDDVLACAMGLYCIGSATLYKGQVRTRQKPKDFKSWKKWK